MPGLDDRLTAERGTFYLPAIDALVQRVLDQSRRERAEGRRTGIFITGYPGSPLAGLDLALGRRPGLLADHGVVHVPGANEELAATALMGTQMLDAHPHSDVDGVVAFWYGKGPGVDRSGDAMKHGNFAGTSKGGAVVVLSGEDHEAKSSTMPFQEEYAFQAAGIPILYPGSVAEILRLGEHGVAMSRYSGCWVALKLVSALCDSGETVDIGPADPAPVFPGSLIDGRPFAKRNDFTFFPGRNVEIERHLYEERHAAVVAYARANGLDRVEVATERDRLGIVSAGKSFSDLRQAIAGLGLGDDDLRRAGIRLLHLGLVYPLDAGAVRAFATGLERVVVVEEKRPFLEDQVRSALCGAGTSIDVLGKRDEKGSPLFPVHGGMDADGVTERLGPLLLDVLVGRARDRAADRLGELAAVRSRRYQPHSGRTPNYCSGCPHSTSTRLAEGQVAWGSPGCHSFASVIEQPSRHVEAMTQFGGEGVPWIGLSPFTDRRHIVQNVGDGSLFHSSYLNIRFCVAAGVDITFKVLYNGFVANTGAQPAVGARPVPELIRLLAIEGVRRIALVTKSPRAYRRAQLPAVTTVHAPSEVERVSAELAELRGVTVMIYDETCANERRRRQKRGLLPPPERYVLINERVCEGCGDCGRVSNCMSLEEVPTELGPKVRIHPSSCNQDFSCLAGNCPSFTTVATAPGTGYAKPSAPRLAAAELPDPPPAGGPEGEYHLYVAGVGGTGVITMNAVLGTAAAMDGWQVCSYDQTGAAQKWGPVISSLVLTPEGRPMVERVVGAGRADLYLALDSLSGATAANLDRCDPARTAAVVNTTILPSGEMVRDVGFRPSADGLSAAIAEYTDPGRTVFVGARRLAEDLFGNYQMTNFLAAGVAYQAGLLPIRAASIEAALELNGVAVDDNVQAFRYGRLWAHDPGRVQDVCDALRPAPAFGSADALAQLRRRERRAHAALMERTAGVEPATRELLGARVADLIGYQSAAWAERYLEFVLSVAARERAATDDAGEEVTRLVARYLHKLMSYKDEYEVARLYLDPSWQRQLSGTFTAPRRVTFHLHPPVLRALGRRQKIQVGPGFVAVFRILARMRRLRGTSFDLFGRSAARREERELIEWYRDSMERALEHLEPATRDLVGRVAALPEGIRGYEEVKSAGAERARREARELLDRLSAVPAGG